MVALDLQGEELGCSDYSRSLRGPTRNRAASWLGRSRRRHRATARRQLQLPGLVVKDRHGADDVAIVQQRFSGVGARIETMPEAARWIRPPCRDEIFRYLSVPVSNAASTPCAQAIEEMASPRLGRLVRGWAVTLIAAGKPASGPGRPRRNP